VTKKTKPGSKSEMGLFDGLVEGTKSPLACIHTNDVQHEADKSVMSGEWQKDNIDEHNVLEVVDNTFSVKEIHRGSQEVPIEISLSYSARQDSSAKRMKSPAYQFKDFVNRRLLALLGTFEIAMTWKSKHRNCGIQLNTHGIPL